MTPAIKQTSLVMNVNQIFDIIIRQGEDRILFLKPWGEIEMQVRSLWDQKTSPF